MAATQDDFYQQLMSNNGTWAVIDRGEPESYLAIWDLIDYVGQGGLFQKQITLLQLVWEETALANVTNSELLSHMMPRYQTKKSMFEFVKHQCLSLSNTF
jgi:hypothetical protein